MLSLKIQRIGWGGFRHSCRDHLFFDNITACGLIKKPDSLSYYYGEVTSCTKCLLIHANLLRAGKFIISETPTFQRYKMLSLKIQRVGWAAFHRSRYVHLFFNDVTACGHIADPYGAYDDPEDYCEDPCKRCLQVYRHLVDVGQLTQDDPQTKLPADPS